MTAEQLREYVKTYRSENFGGGLIPFDMAYNDALDSGHTRATASTAGVYAVLDAFVNYVEIKESGDEKVTINLHTGERV